MNTGLNFEGAISKRGEEGEGKGKGKGRGGAESHNAMSQRRVAVVVVDGLGVVRYWWWLL
jgi:hypothetical protein